ncbi:MAG: hypothetical protein IKG94_01385, partial [Candidatus Methanomethylophilaceae archaeon]|nr:hypothetical protein [Candidatus Methanomethylophilaceae archaeon]
MKASTIKLVAAALIATFVVASIPFIGFTVDTLDEKQGVMIDFAYYNVDWVEMDLDGMTGDEALKAACEKRGYKLEYD